MQRYVDANILAGCSSAVLVGRDLVDLKCIGWADKEVHTPLRVDHIFRVFSNTKLITSCAANAKDPEAARALIGFLSSPAATTVIKAKGMEPG
jgi:hypothetical protein